MEIATRITGGFDHMHAPTLNVKCLDPGSGREIPAIRHVAGPVSQGFYPRNLALKTGSFGLLYYLAIVFGGYGTVATVFGGYFYRYPNSFWQATFWIVQAMPHNALLGKHMGLYL